MSDWIKAADLAVVVRRKKLRVTVGEQDVALFYVNGEVFALGDICIHKQNSLSKGLVFKGNVICPGHQWAFDLKTGWVDEWSRCQPTFAVMVKDDGVYVDPRPRIRESEPPPDEKYWQGD